ncbi:MAG: TolC family protein [Deltaproteobacteria bacterium]|nr:TolC family protein [Deltaproteobacteria bacterium]
MRGIIINTTVVLFLFMLVGCATVRTDEEWGRFQETAYKLTSRQLLWEKSEEEQAAIREEVDKLLLDGLSREEAVRIALLNNRELQSSFEEIGISKSDLVQAGLFTNPSIGAIFRFLLGGGGTNIEAEGFLNISDLWQIPFRKKAAAARMESTIMRVGQKVLDVAAEAKRAYNAAYYLAGAGEETEDILQRFREISEEAIIRRNFGFMNEQDVYLAQIMVVEAEIEVSRFDSEMAMAKSRLDRTLGLSPGQLDYEILGGMAEEQIAPPGLEEAIPYAMEHRLDVQMARFEILEAERKLELENVLILKHVGLGVSFEKDPDESEVFGPGIDIQMPLFDQNQARISRARYMVRQARKNLQALGGQVREEITGDLEKVRFQQSRLRHLREKVIPLREKALDYAERWVNAMQLNRLYLLEAQKGLLQSRRESLQALLAFNNALVDLELHMGGKLERTPSHQ